MTTGSEERTHPAHLVRDSYEALAEVVRPLGEDDSWLPTDCAGWAVRDLVFHLLADAQRALVALHTPAGGPPDRDAVTYWRDWTPAADGAAQERRWNRVCAGMIPEFGQLKDLYLETAAAAVTAASAAEPRSRVGTQEHVLTVADLLTTLGVEATVHHLDLTVALPTAPGPSPAGLTAVRATLDGLLGRPVPLDWSDEHYARAATGRTPLTESERNALGPDADRVPLFG
ncbi:maleylpyruvate isomerase family mycothiol-dependent enzyme [Streptomyces sp. E2N166]|uniref:maleylpyruvate isomerase family mycothiol-dependent enzyme n=1 Tax=Streptomyces sp. E2N166 TaxID=1851909 RepID=UPI000EF68135|nr:maleylpyruvate isomerase family mycothiol-dependent enzyme [Streptomyces sp. E2N166]